MGATMAMTRRGVKPPARCAPVKKIPCTVPRSRRGIQRENARAAEIVLDLGDLAKMSDDVVKLQLVTG